jgi:hypothetical protein
MKRTTDEERKDRKERREKEEKEAEKNYSQTNKERFTV